MGGPELHAVAAAPNLGADAYSTAHGMLKFY